MTATAPKPRTGFLHRLHCARNGHYWERQLAGDGEGALWVCVRCGKHGDDVPLVAVGPTYHAEPAEEPPVAQVRVEAEDMDDWEHAASPDWPTSWTAPVTDNGADDIIHAADVPQPQADAAAEEAEEAEPEPERRDRRSQPSVTPAVVAVAVVSLAVAGGAAYLAFRRRRRHR